LDRYAWIIEEIYIYHDPIIYSIFNLRYSASIYASHSLDGTMICQECKKEGKQSRIINAGVDGVVRNDST